MDEKTKKQKELILETISNTEDEKLIGLIYQILARLVKE